MKKNIEYYKDKIGEWRFRIKANNGKIIAQGEGYKSKQGCVKGIHSLQGVFRIVCVEELEGK